MVHVIPLFFLHERTRAITRRGSRFFFKPHRGGWGLAKITPIFFPLMLCSTYSEFCCAPFSVTQKGVKLLSHLATAIW